ncbi:MAG: transcriptional regulator GutM [Nocardioides sp.]
MTALVLLGAVAAGWMVQLYLTYLQSMSFNSTVATLRRDGTVSVGSGGRRYRGGRAFVAIAVDDRGLIRNAVTLQGFTTFARSRPLPALFDVKVAKVRGDRSIDGLSPQQREAARQAATLLTNQTAAPA